MSTHRLVVAHNDAGWTIRFRGRDYDTFPRKNDAIGTALRWAWNARQQGHRVTVLLEGEGGSSVVPAQWFTPARAAEHTRRTMRGTLWASAPVSSQKTGTDTARR
jgi:hypothetical protein